MFVNSPDICSHSERREVKIREFNEDTWDYEFVVKMQEVGTEEDIDLHRYQCTLCGKIGYYSSLAKEAWETGKSNPDIKCFVKGNK